MMKKIVQRREFVPELPKLTSISIGKSYISIGNLNDKENYFSIQIYLMHLDPLVFFE